MSVAKRNKITFVDYTFVLDGEDIIFDKELDMDRIRFYEGKTFKVKQTSEGIMLKFVEDWDMMVDPEDINWSKYEDKESTTH